MTNYPASGAPFAAAPLVPNLWQRSLLATMVQSNPAPCCSKDTQRRYLAVNTAYAQLFGLTPDDLLGLRDDELMLPGAALASARHDLSVLASSDAVSGRLCIHVEGAQPLTVACRAQPLLVGENLIGLVCWIDCGSLSRERWETRERKLLSHVGQVAHELRSPLSGVIGLVRLLMTEANLHETHRTWMQAVDQCCEHLSQTINDLVDVGLVCTGQVTLQSQPVALGTLMREVADWTRPQLRPKPDVVLHTNLSGFVAGCSDPTVLVDGLRLRQLLLNLLSNAARATDAGQIMLRCSAVCSTAQADITQRWRFEVVDSGAGIAADRLAELFSPGSALEIWADSCSGRRGGLGLLVSRRLARAMGGELKAHSEPGKGSTFWFEIDAPLAPV